MQRFSTFPKNVFKSKTFSCMFCHSTDNVNTTTKILDVWKDFNEMFSLTESGARATCNKSREFERTSASFSWFTYKDGETGQSDWPDNHYPKEDSTQRETLVRWPATPVMLYWIGIKRWMDQSASVTFSDKKKKGSLAFCLHFEIFLGVIAQKPKQTFWNRSRWRYFCIGEGKSIYKFALRFYTNLLVNIVFQSNTYKIP